MPKKIALFIDYANLLSSCRTIGHNLDYQKLCDYIEDKYEGRLEFKNIYFAYPGEGTRDRDTSGIHRMGTFLKKELGFHIKKKVLKRIEIRDEEGKIILGPDGNPICKEKGNLDVELVMDVMQTWHHFDTMIIFSGDSDFAPLTSFLIWKGKKVYVFSTIGNISSELRHASNGYVDIRDLALLYRS